MKGVYISLLLLTFLVYPSAVHAYEDHVISKNTACLFISKIDSKNSFAVRLIRSPSVIEYSPFTPLLYHSSLSYLKGEKKYTSFGSPDRGTSGYLFMVPFGDGKSDERVNIISMDIPVFSDVGEEYKLCNPSDLLKEGEWEAVDPITGNLFKASAGGDGFIEISIFNQHGELIADIRMDPFSQDFPVDISRGRFKRKVKIIYDDIGRVVALDLSGIPISKLKDGYYWFARNGKLAEFIYDYLSSGAVSYVNFILNTMIFRRITGNRWPRLPIIPSSGEPVLKPLDKDTSLKFKYREKMNWFEDHGENSYICTLATFVKLVEDRDCKFSDSEGDCPDYSEMFMFHGLLKTRGEISDKWDLASGFFDAVKIYSRQGMCSERWYPYDKGLVESDFSSETVFSGMVKKRLGDLFEFEDNIPSNCREEGLKYLSSRGKTQDDFIVSGTLHFAEGEQKIDVSAQRKELFYLLVSVLNRGYSVGVIGRKGHAALAMPWNPDMAADTVVPSSSEKGIALWSSTVDPEHRIMTIPLKNMKKEIDQIIFENFLIRGE